MEQSLFTQLFLPAAIGIIMLGLGLSLSVENFKRVIRFPKAILIALSCQMILLPLICFVLVKFSGLNPALAVGMMLLAASPGGTTSNLYSHLAKGDVALNISLTAINSLLSLFMLPVIVNLSLYHFMDYGQQIQVQFKKVVEIFSIVLVPVAIGMLIKKLKPAFAAKITKSVKTASALLLVLIIVLLFIKEKQVLIDNFSVLGWPLLLFNLISLAVGYFVPRLLKVEKSQSVSISMEIGLHNGAFAIYIALNVLQNSTMSIPPAIYSLLMFFTAAIFGYWVNRRKAS